MTTVNEEKAEIREMFARYCIYTDSGQIQKYADLFTEDCDWDGGAFGRVQGRNGVLEKMKSAGDAPKGLRHITTNTVIEVQGTEAKATSYALLLSVVGESPTVIFSGLYFDHLVKVDGQWLIKRRQIRTNFEDAEIK